MNVWIFCTLLFVVDFGVYLTADKECRQSAPSYKLIPGVGGWMAAAYCQGKGIK